MPPLFAAALVVLLEVTCLGAILPVLIYYTQDLGGDPIIVGVFYGLVAAPKVVLNPIWGSLSDRIGRRPSLVIATLGSLIASVLWALAPSIGALALTPLIWLGISRLVNGIFAAQATLAFAIASDTSSPEKRTAAMGMLGAAFGVGMTLGPLLGGWIGSESHVAVGWLCVGLEVAALLVIALLLKETRTEPPAESTPERDDAPVPPTASRTLRELAAHPGLRWLLGSCLLLTVGYSVLTPTLGLIGEQWYGYDERTTGYAFFLWGVIAVLVQGGVIRPAVRILGETTTVLIGNLLMAAGFLIVAVGPVEWLFWAALVLMGMGGGFTVPSLVGLMSLHVLPAEQGSVHGLNQSATALGRAISYFLAGALFAISPALPYGLAAGLILLAIPLLLLAPRPVTAQP
jgi:DHA1 family tetracycline resistance protein-like MFS transporter